MRLMKTQIPAAALRAARALLRQSRAEICDGARVNEKSMRDAEAGRRKTDPSNLRLRDYYESQGLEFVGTVDIGSGAISGLGVRWRDPRSHVQPPENVAYKSTDVEFALGAARAFLGLTAKDAAAALGIHRQTLPEIESSQSCDSHIQRKLVQFYRTRGIIFLGWRDENTDRYFGVGVMTTEQVVSTPSASLAG